jgi:hypothetical protein
VASNISKCKLLVCGDLLTSELARVKDYCFKHRLSVCDIKKCEEWETHKEKLR